MGQDSEYRVVRTKWGVAVYGIVPAGEVCVLLKHWEEARGWDMVDSRIGEKLGATIVVGERKELECWREDLGI